MPVATAGQEAVLQSEARVRVVKAAPGSGKTWLISELVRREVASWQLVHCGTAALSFTNVAGGEIVRAVGSAPTYPHFVGTIDSFLFRYAVQPFAKKFNTQWPRAELLPADATRAVDRARGFGAFNVKIPGSNDRISIFEVDFVREGADGIPVFAYSPRGRRKSIQGRHAAEMLDQKKRVWRTTGLLSHSDAAYVAAKIIASDDARSGAVRALLARRFPLIIVDEAQDTGYFRSEALRRLLEQSDIRGVVVGDPDQAIYEFAGASPELMNMFLSLTGSEEFDLNETKRCSSSVTRVVNQLRSTGSPVSPSPDAGAGETTLVSYSDLTQAAAYCLGQTTQCDDLVVLARSKADLERIGATRESGLKGLGSKEVECLFRAVSWLRSGHPDKALHQAGIAIGRVVLGAADALDWLRVDSSVPVSEARRVTVEILVAVDARAVSTSILAWSGAVKEIVEHVLLQAGLWESGMSIRRPHRNKVEGLVWPPSRGQARQSESGENDFAGRAHTIHGVKGETHERTLLFVPPRRRSDRCPSQQWWPTGSEESEERRVAFVAASRPRHSFILVVHRDTYRRLTERRPDFVESFSERVILPVE